MIGKKNLQEITDKILVLSKASETEVLVVVENNALTRFANNMVHQNVTCQDIAVSVRSVFGRKVGVSSSNINIKYQKSKIPPTLKLRRTGKNTNQNLKIDKDLEMKLEKLVRKSEEIAKNSSEDPEFAGLPILNQISKIKDQRSDQKQKIKSVFDSTINFTAKQRVEAVGKIIKKAEKAGLTAFGSLQTGLTEYCIANSKGVFGYHPVSVASLNIRVFSAKQNQERSGYAGFISTNISDIDFEKLAEQAIKKATLGDKMVEIDPGEYEVILEEPAIAEMMQFLAYLGFGAKNFHEGSSFISGRLGEKILGENVTIHDDPFHPLTIPLPFDFEGLPKNKTSLVENGVVKNIVYDYQYGCKHGKKPTGHGLPAPNTEGPLPFHLSLHPGTTPKAELIKKVKKGILVTRFWYVNPIHPKLLNITGMTRDGTFYIENGKIKGAIRNLRFTQSIPEALSNVLDIASEVKAEEGWVGATVVPAVRIGKWNFTGESKI